MLPTIEARVEEDREKVLEAGGLFIVGTERHESRRIDNQLRGRSGRQGDPGESRFFLSAEDDLVRLFAGDRIYRILDRLGPVSEEGEEEPIEAKMLSKQIESAQRKVEEQNFLIRKRVLEYDDVMNQQREIVYQYRDRVLEGQDMGETAREQIAQVIGRLVDEYTPGDYVEDWDLEGLWVQLDQVFHVDFGIEELDREGLDREQLKRAAVDDALKLYDEREEELGEELMRALERFLLLQIIDQRWREHLYDMDYLREGIHLRGFAQIDPLVAYKNEGFGLFEDLMNTHLVGLRPDGLQRPGRGRGPERRRARSSQQQRRPARGGAELLRRRPRTSSRAPTAARATASRRDEPHARADRRRAAARRRARADRPQRPVLVRVGQEVQEVPRRIAGRPVRVAVLGFWHVHAADYADLAAAHPETELVAVWDDDAERGPRGRRPLRDRVRRRPRRAARPRRRRRGDGDDRRRAPTAR